MSSEEGNLNERKLKCENRPLLREAPKTEKKAM